jgi:hypothetical protein
MAGERSAGAGNGRSRRFWSPLEPRMVTGYAQCRLSSQRSAQPGQILRTSPPGVLGHRRASLFRRPAFIRVNSAAWHRQAAIITAFGVSRKVRANHLLTASNRSTASGMRAVSTRSSHCPLQAPNRRLGMGRLVVSHSSGIRRGGRPSGARHDKGLVWGNVAIN